MRAGLPADIPFDYSNELKARIGNAPGPSSVEKTTMRGPLEMFDAQGAGQPVTAPPPMEPAGFNAEAQAVARNLCRRCGSALADLQEDCVVETLLTLHCVRRQIRAAPVERRRAYMAVCCRRAAGRVLRRERRQRLDAVSLDALSASGVEVPAADTVGISSCSCADLSLTDAVSQPDLIAALASLPPGWLEVLNLRLMHELSHDEIAAQVGTSAPSVRWEVSRRDSPASQNVDQM